MVFETYCLSHRVNQPYFMQTIRPTNQATEPFGEWSTVLEVQCTNLFV